VFKAGVLSGLKKDVEDQAGTGLGIGQKLLEGKELCLFLGLSLTQNRERQTAFLYSETAAARAA
jgi:hypothetical protein